MTRRLAGWQLGLAVGLIAVALGMLLDGIYRHEWAEILRGASLRAAIELPIFAGIFHWLGSRGK